MHVCIVRHCWHTDMYLGLQKGRPDWRNASFTSLINHILDQAFLALIQVQRVEHFPERPLPDTQTQIYTATHTSTQAKYPRVSKRS